MSEHPTPSTSSSPSSSDSRTPGSNGSGGTPDRSGLPRFPARDSSGHKGTFGTVAVMGGCCAGGKGGTVRMVGAPALAAIGALRTGAGRARLVMPAPILPEGITIAPSATGLGVPVDSDGFIAPHDATAAIDAVAETVEALVVGPGMGVSAGTAAAVLRAIQGDIPTVIDADGITAMGEIAELHMDLRAPVVVTPHVGEFRRIAAKYAVGEDITTEQGRREGAEHLARRLGCIVVLKGPGTVVSDGFRTWVNQTGGPVLATAGTGDVLAGVIAGIAAQFVGSVSAGGKGRTMELFDAARLGVAAHGLAGDLWARHHGTEAGMLATELAEFVPGAVEELRRG